MTEPTPPPESHEGAGDLPEPDSTEAGSADEHSPNDKEAAKYRRRLREAEKERDGLQSRLESLQRGEVERLAADKLADPADVWRDGAELSGLLNDDGNIDVEKVGGLVDGLLESHSHWGIQRSSAPTTFRSGASTPSPPKSTTWAGALKGAE